MIAKKGIRTGVILSLVLGISVFLLLWTGKEHAIVLDNRKGSPIFYSVDGEAYQKLGKKKIQRFVKGPEHMLYFQTEQGEKFEVSSSFAFREEKKLFSLPEVKKAQKLQ